MRRYSSRPPLLSAISFGTFRSDHRRKQFFGGTARRSPWSSIDKSRAVGADSSSCRVGHKLLRPFRPAPHRAWLSVGDLYSTFDPALDLWRENVSGGFRPNTSACCSTTLAALRSVMSPRPLRVPGTLVTLAPMAPFTRPGATVCDFIRPSQATFAASVGCPGATAPAVNRFAALAGRRWVHERHVEAGTTETRLASCRLGEGFR